MENNLFKKDPSWILFLGACPALAASAGVKTALGMGAAVLVLTVLSALVLCALRRFIPSCVKLAAALLVAAFLAAAVQMLMGAFLPKAAQAIPMYLAVLAVDMLIFAAGENASDVKLGAAVLDSVKVSVYFAVVVVITAVIREVFGAGEFFGMEIPFLSQYSVPVLAKAPGAFFVLAIVAAMAKNVKAPELGGKGFAFKAAGR